MMSLTAFLDWLDEAAGGLIRLAYLAAGVTAVAVYFGAGQLPPLVDAALNAALPWALAFALETHTYLTARRVRAAWQDHDRAGLQVNAVVLAILLAFSAWNQLGYLSGSWTPPHSGPLALPAWLAYAVRALIVPSAFMAAAFLAPLAPPITAQIEGEARATLADVFKIARKQRRKMLKEAEASGRDMTGALVELVSDPETRRIISHAYGAIKAAPVARSEGAQAAVAAQGAYVAIGPNFEAGDPHTATPEPNLTAQAEGADTLALPTQPDRPPTGPGTPLPASKPTSGRSSVAPNVTPLRAPRPARQSRRVAARANARSGKRGTAEQRVRAVLAAEPTIEFAALVRRAKVSESTASKWLAVVEAERASASGQYAQ